VSLFTVPGLVVLFFANVDKKIELDYKDLVVSDDDLTKLKDEILLI